MSYRQVRKVRVGARYEFVPVPFDKLMPPAGQKVPEGAIVKVINLPGCPTANVMGMCYIEYLGTFAGMVCTNSLMSLR